MTDRKFPIVPLLLQEDYTEDELRNLLLTIKTNLFLYQLSVGHLNDHQPSKTYRNGSRNVRKLVHHVADIALLHYFRMKKAVAETSNDMTLIDIDAWATTPDVMTSPVSMSLTMFDTIHQPYAAFAEALDEKQLAASHFHPVRKIRISQKQALAVPAWHARSITSPISASRFSDYGSTR